MILFCVHSRVFESNLSGVNITTRIISVAFSSSFTSTVCKTEYVNVSIYSAYIFTELCFSIEYLGMTILH